MLLHYRPVFKGKILIGPWPPIPGLGESQLKKADQVLRKAEQRPELRSSAIVLRKPTQTDQPLFWLILHKVSLSGTPVRVLSHLSGHQDARRQN